MSRAFSLSSVCMATTLLIACAVTCGAQSPASGRQRVASPQHPATQTRAPQTAQTSTSSGEADEDFDLNILERRITEQNFFASTEISAGDESARGLALRVGVAVGAERIDVLLRNVQGHVRFRASLDALRRVLDARRPAPSVNESPPVVP
ncbi:MAG: hypothetical protein QOE33_24 [Acidobacteriota bacterium]|nr:hypothetical protein [Acidobacteriota bacterium]